MPGTRSRRASAILLLTILVLGVVMVAQHRRETRLKEALALFRSRGHQDIHTRLKEPSQLGSSAALTLSWDASVSLEELIAQLKVFSSRRTFVLKRGFPIEIDAAGLKEAGQSLASRVQIPPAPGKDDVSLDELLRRILGPINLAYEIKDGALLITSSQAVDRNHQRILQTLQQPVLLTWPDGASLEYVLRQIRLSTRGAEFPLGLPVYLDSVNLDDTELAKTVVAPSPTEELPIREHFARVLEPLRMTYELRNGALMIISHQNADEPGEAPVSPLE